MDEALQDYCRLSRPTILTPMQPLRLSHIPSSPASASAWTRRWRRWGGPQRIAALRVRDGGSANLCRRGGGARQRPTAGRIRCLRLPQQPAGGEGAGPGWVRRSGGAAVARYGAAADRLVHGHQHLGHPACGIGLSGARCGRRVRCLPWFDYAATQNTGSLAAYLRRRLGRRGAVLRCILRLRFDGQGVRQCRAHDRRPGCAMPPSSAARTRCA